MYSLIDLLKYEWLGGRVYGFIRIFKSQFIEVIEGTDQNANTMVYRFPVHNNEIKMGAELTVRESQVATFVNEGEIADVFKPLTPVFRMEYMDNYLEMLSIS